MFLLTQLSRFLAPALLAALLSWLIDGGVRRFALARGIVAKPRGRDSHTTPVPRLGGVGMVVSFALVLTLTAWLLPDVHWFTTLASGALDRPICGLLAGSLILLLIGVVDDIRGLPPAVQLIGQVLAALCVVSVGVGIDFITNPFGGAGAVIYLNNPAWLSDLLTILWLVLTMNVLNWFDGLDGLAGGVSVIAAVMLSLLSLMVGSPTGIVAVLLVLAGATTGFLVWNWHPARVFMGTSGSLLLGYVLGVAAVIAGGKLATTFIILGVPILDALWVIVARLAAGQPVFRADRRHLHHRLLAAGWTVRQTVTFMYLLAASFGAIALWHNSSLTKMILAAVLFGLMWWLNRLLVKRSS